MSLSLYEIAVPTMVRALRNLSDLLAKGEAHAKANGLAPESLIEAKLASDMYNLARQVQAASDGAKSGVARLAGMTPPSMPDTETTFAELQARIAKTLDFIRTVSADQMAGEDERTIAIPFPGRTVEFKARDYLLGFVLPNFLFHVTTAYAILRHKGVPLGKMDFLGTI